MAGLAVASLALSGAVIIRRPDLVMGADFLFHDPGHNLFIADKMLSGASLYRDVFSQYGPVSAYVYTLVASLVGNTPTVYCRCLPRRAP